MTRPETTLTSVESINLKRWTESSYCALCIYRLVGWLVVIWFVRGCRLRKRKSFLLTVTRRLKSGQRSFSDVEAAFSIPTGTTKKGSPIYTSKITGTNRTAESTCNRPTVRPYKRRPTPCQCPNICKRPKKSQYRNIFKTLHRKIFVPDIKNYAK